MTAQSLSNNCYSLWNEITHYYDWHEESVDGHGELLWASPVGAVQVVAAAGVEAVAKGVQLKTKIIYMFIKVE